jgi:DNA ligase-1
MQNPEFIISKLEADNSRLVKEAILKEAMEEGNDDFFQGVRMALDPLYTFGVAQMPEKLQNGPGLFWDEFTGLVADLSNRALTGNAARDEVKRCADKATLDQWHKWYRRILIKDLRCGVSEKTVNKVAKATKTPQYSVPIFGCQLAQDSVKAENKMVGKKQIEVKLDGVRVITIVYPNGKVEQFSRNGKEIVNFPGIKEQFANNSSGLKEPMVFDGEIMSASFQDLMKQIYRKSDAQTDDAVLYLFDVLPLSAFEKGIYKLGQTKRTAWLHSWLDTMNMKNIQYLDTAVIDLGTDEGQKLFKMYNKSAVENGYEGIMIKDINAPYECKRTSSWLKLKPFIEVTLEVTDVEEGTGRNEGKLGALVCSGTDDGQFITVNVGSGLTDDNRDQFWASRDRLIGQLVEVRADAITQNQDGTYSLRFPRFLRFRGFEPGEKI